MPAPLGKPVVIEGPDPRVIDSAYGVPSEGEYLLYDEDFPEETLSKYALAGPIPPWSFRPLRRPHFSPPQLAAWVFAHDSDWIRFQLSRSKADFDHRLGLRRLAGGRGNPASQGERRLTLPDIERFAWALYSRNTIDGEQLQNAITIITTVARQYGIIPRERTRQ